jgi:hypothetical protein
MKTCPGMPEHRRDGTQVCASPANYHRLWISTVENFEDAATDSKWKQSPMDISDHVHCIRDADCSPGMRCDCSKNDLKGLRRYECSTIRDDADDEAARYRKMMSQ